MRSENHEFAAVLAGLSLWLPLASLFGITWAGIGVAVAVALFATAPDVDHPSRKTIAFPYLWIYAALFKAVRGTGHRGFPHSLAGAAAFSLVVAAVNAAIYYGALFFLLPPAPVAEALGSTLASMTLAAPTIYLLHIAADAPTQKGVNIAGRRVRGFLYPDVEEMYVAGMTLTVVGVIVASFELLGDVVAAGLAGLAANFLYHAAYVAMCYAG